MPTGAGPTAVSQRHKSQATAAPLALAKIAYPSQPTPPGYGRHVMNSVTTGGPLGMPLNHWLLHALRCCVTVLTVKRELTVSQCSLSSPLITP